MARSRYGAEWKQDLLAVLQFRDTAAAKLFSFAILERVLRDQFEIVDDEYGDRDATRAAIRDPKDVPCDTVGNPADPDASYNAHRHRTVRSKGCLSNKTALAMVFKLTQGAQNSWRRLDGHNQLPKLIVGVKFTDGIEAVRQQPQAAA